MAYLQANTREVPPLYPGKRSFERRIDERSATDIGDALRAVGVQAAAMAMEHLQVDVQVALRMLAGNHDRDGKRRGTGPGTPVS